jgi:hypothetical protein
VHGHLSAAFGLDGVANGQYWMYCDRPATGWSAMGYRHGLVATSPSWLSCGTGSPGIRPARRSHCYRHGGAGRCLPPRQAARRCHMCEAVYVAVREEVCMADAAPAGEGSGEEMKRKFREALEASAPSRRR